MSQLVTHGSDTFKPEVAYYKFYNSTERKPFWQCSACARCQRLISRFDIVHMLDGIFVHKCSSNVYVDFHVPILTNLGYVQSQEIYFDTNPRTVLHRQKSYPVKYVGDTEEIPERDVFKPKVWRSTIVKTGEQYQIWTISRCVHFRNVANFQIRNYYTGKFYHKCPKDKLLVLFSIPTLSENGYSQKQITYKTRTGPIMSINISPFVQQVGDFCNYDGP